MNARPADIFAASSQPATLGQRVLIVTADNTQDLEFFYPYYRFIEAGYYVDVATPGGGSFRGKQGMGLQQTHALRDISPTSYDLLYIPGGKAPEALKKSVEALALVKSFVASGKPVAAICHGGQLLAAANVVEGRRIAAWPEVEGEIAEAGGQYVNEETVVDGQFITARWPGDLPAHLAASIAMLHNVDSTPARKTAKG